MTREEYDDIIDNRFMPFHNREGIELWEHCEEYIQSLEARITELETPKSCDGCKYREDSSYDNTYTCKFLDSSIVTMPQESYGIYIDDANEYSCINYEPKVSE